MNVNEVNGVADRIGRPFGGASTISYLAGKTWLVKGPMACLIQ